MITNQFLDRKLYEAFLEARKGKQGTSDEFKFEMNFLPNLIQLRQDIVRRTYEPSRGTAFISHNPVDREIFAAPFRDRIVHHFIYSFIIDWWERHLIYSSYSCRVGKGTDEGIRDLYRKMRKVSQNFKVPTVVVKIDLSSYFCSIPRQKLYDRVEWGLKTQFLQPGHTIDDRDICRILKFLCRQVIFDDPTKGVYIKGTTKEWERYPKRKSLFYQKPGVGIVIGNLTSQVFSNIYLDLLDRFALYELGVKGYGRYVDDAFFVIPADEKESFFREKMPRVVDYINGMGLIINPKKTFCQNIEKGIPFLGTLVYPYRVLPGKRLAKNFRMTVRQVQEGEKDLDCLISYIGRMKHMDSQHLIERVFNDYGLDYVWQKGIEFGSQYYTSPKLYKQKQIV